ncbi:gamma-glutamylcyclotransferase [Vibrio anguillarum]|nr:gamma-glutamylcyclotransferase [Vibrio anguillarum]
MNLTRDSHMQHLVFVYGTLRRGESNAHLLEKSEMLGSFYTPADYALYDLGPYPGLTQGQQSIAGEVYRVDEQTLAKLDILEDIPIEYRRETIETPFGRAWIYLYQDHSRLTAVINSGDWCQRV